MTDFELKLFWDRYYQDVSDRICGVGKYVRMAEPAPAEEEREPECIPEN